MRPDRARSLSCARTHVAQGGFQIVFGFRSRLPPGHGRAMLPPAHARVLCAGPRRSDHCRRSAAVGSIVEPWRQRPDRRGHQGLDPRRDRRDAAGAAVSAGRGLRPQLVAKIEALNPGGSIKDRAGDRTGRGRRARREAEAGRHDRRAHERQHRHRPGDRGLAQGLPGDRGDAGQDVQGEDRPAARLRRGGGGGSHRGAARVARVLLPGGRPAHRGDPRRLPAEPVPKPGEPGGPLPHHRPGAVAPVGRPDHPLRGGRRHRRHDHGGGPLPARAEAGHRDHRGGPRRLDLLERAGQAVPRGGRGRGLLARDLRPLGGGPLRHGLRQGLVPLDAPARRDRGDPRRRLLRHGALRRLPGGARDRRPRGDGRGDPARRRALVSVEGLQRRLDAPVRLPRARRGADRRRRPAPQARRGRDPAAAHGRDAREGPRRGDAAARAPRVAAAGGLRARPAHGGRLRERARPAAARDGRPRAARAPRSWR